MIVYPFFSAFSRSTLNGKTILILFHVTLRHNAISFSTNKPGNRCPEHYNLVPLEAELQYSTHTPTHTCRQSENVPKIFEKIMNSDSDTDHSVTWSDESRVTGSASESDVIKKYSPVSWAECCHDDEGDSSKEIISNSIVLDSDVDSEASTELFMVEEGRYNLPSVLPNRLNSDDVDTISYGSDYRTTDDDADNDSDGNVSHGTVYDFHSSHECGICQVYPGFHQAMTLDDLWDWHGQHVMCLYQDSECRRLRLVHDMYTCTCKFDICTRCKFMCDSDLFYMLHKLLKWTRMSFICDNHCVSLLCFCMICIHVNLIFAQGSKVMCDSGLFYTQAAEVNKSFTYLWSFIIVWASQGAEVIIFIYLWLCFLFLYNIIWVTK